MGIADLIVASQAEVTNGLCDQRDAGYERAAYETAAKILSVKKWIGGEVG